MYLFRFSGRRSFFFTSLFLSLPNSSILQCGQAIFCARSASPSLLGRKYNRWYLCQRMTTPDRIAQEIRLF
ncbi:hypothetical protein BJ166DRAFT_543475 [Pestalotiopsis sp. NC0098]|nr:hypothetical protein BJ166DRAFT_543475 [Pestalotiopsis sp. NC0098]